MKTRYVYALIAPVATKFVDNKDTPPLLTGSFLLNDGREWEIALLGTKDTITAVRCTMPNSQDDFGLDDQKRHLHFLDYMLDCLRLAYDPEVHYFSPRGELLTFFNLLESGHGPQADFRISEPINPEYEVPTDAIKMLLSIPPRSVKPIVHLLAQGADTRSPLQFRFLSFYKILELHYRITPNKHFNTFCEPLISEFSAVFRDVVDAVSLVSRLKKLRDRSAHIRYSSDELGFSHLGQSLDELRLVLPPLRHLVTRCISVHYPDSPLTFVSTPAEAAAVHEKIVARGGKPVSLSF